MYTSGVSSVYPASAVRFFPNPVSEILVIDTEVLVQSIDILTITGMHVISKDAGVYHVSVQGMDPGMYLLTMHTADGQVITIV